MVSIAAMNLDIIDNAIQRHLCWIADFNGAIAGTATKDFNLEKARDDTACALGQWFSGPESLELLGDDFHTRAKAIHGTFHEIAAEVIVSLRAKAPPEVTAGLVAALKDLSNSLIDFLVFARKRLAGAPPSWVV